MKRKAITLSLWFITFSFICAGILVAITYAGRTKSTVELLRVQATNLIVKVKSLDKIYDEADQAFARMGTSKLLFFKSRDSADYPLLSTLGRLDAIWPGTPPYISIKANTEPNTSMTFIQIYSRPVVWDGSITNNAIVLGSRIRIHY